MKSYSLELVQRKTGSGPMGKLATVALLGAGAYLGYKNFVKKNKDKESSDTFKENSYDTAAHEGADFTTRILRAAKRIIN